MKIFLTLATVWTAAIIGIVQATEEIPAPAPVVTSQEITAIVHAEEIAPRDEITVTAPEIQPEIVTPLEPIAPGSEILEPVTMDAELSDTEIGYVGATFVLEPCQVEDGSGQVACYWDAATMGNQGGTSVIFLEGEAYYPGG